MNGGYMQVAEIEIIYKPKVKASDRPQIQTSRQAYEIVKDLFPDMEHRERMLLLVLNRNNKVLGSYVVSVGGISGTVCDPKIIFQVCLKANGSALILAHNHPSGSTKPSKNDLLLSQKIKEGSKVLDMQLLDHLIITDEQYLSMADEGML
jgi:DNA repair protein RadC